MHSCLLSACKLPAIRRPISPPAPQLLTAALAPLNPTLPCRRAAAKWTRKLIVAVALCVPLAALAMASMVPAAMDVLDGPKAVGQLPWVWIVQALLATPIQFYVGWTFYKSAWNGLRHG